MEKLVRNRIPIIMADAGKPVNFRKARPEEEESLLKAKLLEEVNEFLRTPTVEEAADVLEVMFRMSLISVGPGVCFSEAQLQSVRKSKSEEKGSFSSMFVMDFPSPKG